MARRRPVHPPGGRSRSPFHRPLPELTSTDGQRDRDGEESGRLVPRERWPDLTIGLGAFAVVGLLPLLLLGYLRASWVGTDQSLLTGRSLEVFAYRLGPEAARRMHHFRFFAERPERLRELPDGVAVYLGHDIAGADNWFVNLRKGQTAVIRHGDFVLRFEPVADLATRAVRSA